MAVGTEVCQANGRHCSQDLWISHNDQRFIRPGVTSIKVRAQQSQLGLPRSANERAPSANWLGFTLIVIEINYPVRPHA
jgi:hypothetical protein